MENDFQAIFNRIRPLFARFEPECVRLQDDAGRYYLGSQEVRANDGYRTWFGGVEIKKGYVSAHLIPVYAYPDMLQAVSPALKKRMQGKSCFNFKVLDEALIDELGAVIAAGAERFRQDGRL